MEVVSGFQHDVLNGWLNFGMENRLAIRSYQFVSRSIMVLMHLVSSVVKIRLRCLLLLRLLKCKVGLRAILDGNLMR